jgi:hypothetical protein
MPAIKDRTEMSNGGFDAVEVFMHNIDLVMLPLNNLRIWRPSAAKRGGGPGGGALADPPALTPTSTWWAMVAL